MDIFEGESVELKQEGRGVLSKNQYLYAEENLLGSGPVTGLIGKFAVPSVIGMLVNAIYSITDQIFIGHAVGILGTAAIHVSFPVMMFTGAFAQLAGVGTGANFNLSLGAGKEAQAKRFVGTGLTLMLMMGIMILCVVQIFNVQILKFCGTTENIFPYAQSYLSIVSVGIPFQVFSHGASGLIRSDGSPTCAMLCSVAGTVVNMLLDWLFIIVFRWGVKGAAFATLVGEGTVFFLCLCYFFRFKSFQMDWRILGLRPGYVVRIVKLGICGFINGTIMMLVGIVMNNALTYYGGFTVYGEDIPLAVAGIAGKLNGFLSAFIVGLTQGCQPILGYNMGAGNYERVRETYDKALTAAFAIGFVAFLIFQMFPRELIQIFGAQDAHYLDFAERYLRIHMLTVGLSGIQPLSAGYFTGTGNVRQGILLSLSRQIFFLVPMLILLPAAFGLDGVLYAGPMADILACALSLTMVSKHLSQIC